jgi:hypothetical protein
LKKTAVHYLSYVAQAHNQLDVRAGTAVNLIGRQPNPIENALAIRSDRASERNDHTESEFSVNALWSAFLSDHNNQYRSDHKSHDYPPAFLLSSHVFSTLASFSGSSTAFRSHEGSKPL